ncbi:MAG: hypothetical protein ACLQVI_29715 [Polyangiaceae bacterium]|jgi:hypothetical protein
MSLRGVVSFFLPTFACALVLLAPSSAHAQMGGMGGGRQQSAPTQSSPTQNRTVGPRAGARNNDDEDTSPSVIQRSGEPLTAPPANPLEIPPEVRERIGTDADLYPPPPVGDMHRSFFPYYEERRGDYRFRTLPPLWLEQTRGLPTAHSVYGEPTKEDRQSLFAGFFYQRRSPDMDVDAFFPALWNIRDGVNHVAIVGPLVHREAPGEHDNWLAPLFFEGSRKDGGYFHSPLLLTTSHWSKETEFHLTLTYYHDRSGTDVDWGLAPFAFGGDNGNLDGGRKKYTFVPFALYYHKEQEVDGSDMTVVGPVVVKNDQKRSVTDVLPFYWHIQGHPETGGVHEDHLTVFPIFHTGYKEDETLFATAVYLHRTTPTVETTLTPFYSFSTTRNQSTRLTAIGPVIPLFLHYHDRDIGKTSVALIPFYYHSRSPRGVDWLTPLFGRFEDYGVSHTYWVAPTLLFSSDAHGWEGDFLPITFFGRSDQNTHAVVAPVFWDFATPKGRTTIAAPLYVRLADTTDDSILQVTGNTVYIQKRVAGGIDWQFHVVPLVSYGGMPKGHWWNFMYGLVGYTHDTDGSETVRALWLPITIRPPDTPVKTAAKGTDALINHF